MTTLDEQIARMEGVVAATPGDPMKAAILASLRRLKLLERLYDIVSKADHFDTGLQVGDDFDSVIEELEKEDSRGK